MAALPQLPRAPRTRWLGILRGLAQLPWEELMQWHRQPQRARAVRCKFGWYCPPTGFRLAALASAWQGRLRRGVEARQARKDALSWALELWRLWRLRRSDRSLFEVC